MGFGWLVVRWRLINVLEQRSIRWGPTIRKEIRMNLSITYDAIAGDPMPDGKAIPYLLELQKYDRDFELCTSSEILIDAARLLFIQGEISKPRLFFQGSEIELNDDGRLSRWPLGFCDEHTKILSEILGQQRKK